MKQKTIFIDGLGLVEGHFSGVGQYILGILRGLDEILDNESFAGNSTPRIRVIIPYDTRQKFLLFNFKHIEFRTVPFSFRVMSALWRRRWLPPMDLLCGRGIYIFPRFVSMPLAFSKSALVIFDLSYELHREYSDEGNAVFLSKQVRKSLKTTGRIITISNNSRQELIEFYRLDPHKVSVATPATDPRIFYRRSKQEIDKVKRLYGIESDYILALSNLEPRKNLDTLVDVYCRLPKGLAKDTALLLVGVNGWKTEVLFNKIVKKVADGHNIVRPNKYVKDRHKPAIISGAKALVYPSHYEGFGMPPLEALACGVPVISSDNSSLPEVIGGAGKYIQSDDEKSLYEAVVDCLERNDKITEEVIEKGPDRAREFSWVKSAGVFLDVAKELSK